MAERAWGGTPRGVLGLAVLAIVAWIVPMMRTQAEQRNRWEADTMLRAGKIDEALAMMSAKSRGEFPPIWDPAPRSGWGEHTPMIEEVATAIVKRDPPRWIGTLYAVKSSRDLFSYRPGGWNNLDAMVATPQPHASGGDAGLLARLRLHERFDDTMTKDDRALLERGISVLEARVHAPENK